MAITPETLIGGQGQAIPTSPVVDEKPIVQNPAPVVPPAVVSAAPVTPSAPADASEMPARPAEAGGFRLKAKPKGSGPQVMPSVSASPWEKKAPAPAPAEVPSSSAPVAAVTPLSVAEAKSAAVNRPPAPELLRETVAPAKSQRLKVVMLVVLLLAGGGGYFYFTRPAAPKISKPAPLAVDKKEKGAVSLPGRMVEKAETIAAGQAAAIDASDGLLEKRGSDPVPVPASAPVAPSYASEATGDKVTAVAPGLSLVSSNAVNLTAASQEFSDWVANAKIGGVFQGSSARAQINGRTIAAGQVANDALGIIFDHVDADSKVIYFRDKSGATASR